MPLLTLSGSLCSLVEKENILVSSKNTVSPFTVCGRFSQNLRKQTYLVLGFNPITLIFPLVSSSVAPVDTILTCSNITKIVHELEFNKVPSW